ncbi:MAG: N-6 DNA methylase [Desulfobacteraceae bacterium]|nr:N-6 DNA methylase [Desulfobacteraceae bacterium]
MGEETIPNFPVCRDSSYYFNLLNYLKIINMYQPLKISDLQDFGKDDKGKVFNQFEEILRHNNISDRSNAFNRIISLILAKIVDENKPSESVTDFQVKQGIDDAETLLERLQSLYSKAMKDYLNEEVIDYKLEDIEREIANFPKQTAKDTLYRIYKELKFYQNNEFAFKEVYNKKLFEENAKVLEEVVRLFQKYRFRYDEKAQFLGDFFESMLESGYKQSEGQFFTPTPIARFIITSIPVKSIIEKKLKAGEKQFLPKVIDFACGSGHFLTEAIAEIADEIKAIDKSAIEDNKSREEIERYKKDMRWAGQYIFGVEKDYRLARTSQVACFMHGDGDANIVFGDGLEKHERLPKDGSFDILIANPPYTIKDFKKHLKVNPHDFEMWEHVTPDSDDIEVFFIERMKQLLCPGGMAGIILPSSILSNAGPYTKAREIILKYFEIKAIAEFGGMTFGATSTNTVTLFLKRRNKEFVTNCQYIAEDFISDNTGQKGDFLNSEELFEAYASQLELSPDDYKTLTARKPGDSVKATDFYKNYKNWFDGLTEVKNLKKRKTFIDLSREDQQNKLDSMFFDMVLDLETEKIFYYLLTHRIEHDPEYFGWYEEKTEDGMLLKIACPQKKAVPQKTLIIKTGSSAKEQEKFLGYKFSNRRGYKGIDFTGDTKLCDDKKRLSPAKVNTYIYQAFQDRKLEISHEISEHLRQVCLTDCIDFDKTDFDKRINLDVSKIYFETKSKYPSKPFKDFATLEYGASLPETKRAEGEYPVVGSNGIVGYHDDFLIEGPAIIVGRKGSAGKINWIEKNCFPIDTAFYCSVTNEKVDKKFFFHLLQLINIENLVGGTGVPGLNRNNVHRLKIPVPPPDIQQKIVSEIKSIEQRDEKAEKVIEKQSALIVKLISDDTEEKKISDIAKLSTVKEDPANNPDDMYNYIGLEHLESNTGKILNWEPTPGSNIKSAKNVFKAGQLLYGKLRPYLNKAVIPDFDGVCSTDILVLDSDYPKLLQRILLSKEFVDETTKKMGGVSLPRIKVKDFLDIKINYPKNPLKVMNKLEVFESEIRKSESSVSDSEDEKKAVLTKYLESYRFPDK